MKVGEQIIYLGDNQLLVKLQNNNVKLTFYQKWLNQKTRKYIYQISWQNPHFKIASILRKDFCTLKHHIKVTRRNVIKNILK
jgi:hypothetical protein